MKRLLTIGFAALLLASAGCSSSDQAGSAPDSPSGAAPSGAVAATADAEGSDFCTLYATQVSQGLVNLRAAEEGGVAQAESIAEELAAKAPVAQSELQAAAPPEPLAWLQAMEEADAKGAAGDFSAMDGVFENLTLLNDWAIANCDAEYAPIFTEYKGVIG